MYDKQTAIEFLLLMRPAGGPYRLELFDGSRWQTPAEYAQHVTLWDDGGDAPRLVWDGLITAADIQQAITQPA